MDWLETDPTGSGDRDVVILGDLNSYAMEESIDAIKAGPDDTVGTADDYTNLIATFGGPYAYSYTFDGQAGYLDHALSTATMLGQTTGADDWHINSDEPDILDYDTSFKPAGPGGALRAERVPDLRSRPGDRRAGPVRVRLQRVLQPCRQPAGGQRDEGGGRGPGAVQPRRRLRARRPRRGLPGLAAGRLRQRRPGRPGRADGGRRRVRAHLGRGERRVHLRLEDRARAGRARAASSS